MRKGQVLVLGIAASLLSLVAGASADGIATTTGIELTQPQSTDDGLYVAFPRSATVMVFGVVSGDDVLCVHVNGTKADLGSTDLRPYGAERSVSAREFRAKFQVRPQSKLRVTVRRDSGARTHAVFVPDTDAAISRLREVVTARPEAEAPHVRLGRALKDAGDLEGAMAEFRAALAIKPSDAYARCELGKAFTASGDLYNAMVQHQLATESNPDYGLNWFHLALATVKAGGPPFDARRAFRYYLNLEPKGTFAQYALAYVGDEYSSGGDRPH